MLAFLPGWLRVAIAALLVVVNVVVMCTPLFVVTLFKAALPWPPLRRWLSRLLVWIAERWIYNNGLLFALLTRTRWEISGGASLSREHSYLVLCNHQSWVDIPVLQKVLTGHAPFLRFFLKSQLFWVPMLGLAWWALDFPFMKRLTRAQLQKRPDLRGSDVLATRRACEKFRSLPVSVMNFVEGTRFTEDKHRRQQSPFKHLLKPKAGGVAYVLEAMGESLHTVLDVTIVYPHGRPTVVDLFSGRVPVIRIDVIEREIPPELLGGDYENDVKHRQRFMTWINKMWRDKDARVEKLLQAD